MLGLIGGSFGAGAASWFTLWGFQHFWGSIGLLLQILQLSISGIVGIAIFALIAAQMKLPEVDMLVSRLRQRFVRR